MESSIHNLSNLKENGILTESEYNEKIEKIESQKAEHSLLSSIEYKQLKSLFDSGILTKKEFKNKFERIRKTNSISKKELEALVELTNLEINKNKTIYDKGKKKNNTPSYLILLAVFLIVTILMLIFSTSNNSYDTEPSLQTNESINNNSTTVQNENYNYSNPQTVKKYIYIALKISSPKFVVIEIPGYYEPLSNNYKPAEYVYGVDWKESNYTTDIIEVEDYNENSKFKLLDEAEKNIRFQLSIFDSNFITDVWAKCKDEFKRKEYENNKSKIISSNILDFDSYSEASIHKRNNN